MKTPTTSDLFNALTMAATSGEWADIPLQWLTESNALLADEQGRNVVFLAASAGMLGRMPVKLLTERTLCAPTLDGDTALQQALSRDYLNLPADVLLRRPEFWQQLPLALADAFRNDSLSMLPCSEPSAPLGWPSA